MRMMTHPSLSISFANITAINPQNPRNRRRARKCILPASGSLFGLTFREKSVPRAYRASRSNDRTDARCSLACGSGSRRHFRDYRDAREANRERHERLASTGRTSVPPTCSTSLSCRSPANSFRLFHLSRAPSPPRLIYSRLPKGRGGGEPSRAEPSRAEPGSRVVIIRARDSRA